jgi:katanin p60 ATPase-containing subunit A1
VYIPLPDMEGRRELFRINLKSLELGEGVDFDELATKAAGYSGADVANVCRYVLCTGCAYRDTVKCGGQDRHRFCCCADLVRWLCRDASMMSVRRIMEKAREKGLGKEQMQALLKQQSEELHAAVTRDDLLLALKKVNRSVSDNDLGRFTEWMAEFGSA